MLIWFLLTAQLVRGVSMDTQRWSCHGHIPNIMLQLDKLIKTDDFQVNPIGTNVILYTRL